ncbi:heparan sulfate 2-O-sulfotransferase 1-like isoform X1 [Mytilus edulis]|uniref:heparan sulfate 2-O-sulfotransferase 1-like isoform X1 n=1 Tax=Mytilus edulis TaxID=6550 RepID=UPI0039EEF8EA
MKWCKRIMTFPNRRKSVIVIGVIFVSMGLICLHLLGEVYKLENARERLERAVADIQGTDVAVGHPRHLSQASDQILGQFEYKVELTGKTDEDLVIIYNRVPKTGSTSFAGIAYDLCFRNKFHVLHVNTTKNIHVLPLSDQVRFVQNVTRWNSMKPAMYHGHLAFLDFSKFGVAKKPLYINIIRKPLDRLVSYYYFVRYGDDFRPSLRRRKAGNTETFDECVAKGGNDCDPVHLWLQIPFFCGQDAECWNPGSSWALERAKYNILQNYLVVGVTEQLGDFIAVIEATLPRFFRGAVALFNEGRKSHLRKTSHKIPPKPETVKRLQSTQVWKMEQAFYEFVQEHFEFTKNQIFEIVDGAYVEKGNLFHYEKIRPR